MIRFLMGVMGRPAMLGWALAGVMALVRYVRVEAETRDGKLGQLAGLDQLSDMLWEEVSTDWMAAFYPRSDVSYFEWPEFTDIFPWQHSGVQFKRNWPIAETANLAEQRMNALLALDGEKRKTAYKETDRVVTRQGNDPFGGKLTPVAQLEQSKAPSAQPYAWRQFDRHFAILDDRFCDRLRPELLRAVGEANMFFSSLLTKYLGSGAAIGCSSAVPDMDFFCGRGGKDVIPLYRDAAGTEPNVTGGLLDALGAEYGTTPTAEDLAAYAYVNRPLFAGGSKVSMDGAYGKK